MRGGRGHMGALLGAVDVFATGTLPVWSSKKPVSQETNLKLDRCRRSDVSEPGNNVTGTPQW
jgi:hypothetical protein